MGSIAKQSLKGSVFIYVGTIVGFITTGLVFPKVLKPEQIGLISILAAYASIFGSFSNLGFPITLTRFFPIFRDKNNKHNGILFIAISITFAGFIISTLIISIFKGLILKEETGLFYKYYNYLYILIFLSAFFILFDHYSKVLFNATVGLFAKDFAQRALILFFILLYYFNLVGFNNFVNLYLLAFFISLIIVLSFLIKENQIFLKPDFSLFNKKLIKEMSSMSLFGVLTSFAGIITLNIDKIMIEKYAGLKLTGIYTIAYFFGSVIKMPSRSLIKISSVHIAEHWKANNLSEIRNIYKKSSIIQFTIGALTLIGLWVNLDNIFRILSEEYSSGRYVIILIGFSILFEVLTNTVSSIIVNSKYYKAHAFMMGVLVVLIIITNMVFIPKYGIAGAAFASMLSKFIYSLMRFFYGYYKLKMQPLSYKYFLVIIIAALSYFPAFFIPGLDSLILDIFVRSSIVLVIYLPLTYIFNISEDINQKINFGIKKIKTIF